MSEVDIDPTRDLEFERAFIRDVLVTAGRLTGIYHPRYANSVFQRLAVGRLRYGDGDYLTKDNLQEVREETPDVATYAMLELQKQRRLGLDDTTFQELRLDLVAAAAYGSVADWYAQRASRLLTGAD